ncbi:MAG: MOSC domain-containing protein [Arenicella sp.]
MKVSQLYIYPVKSLRGIAVEKAELTPLGLRYDRHWMIIDDNNQFVTQRKHPNMVLVKTRLSDNFLHLSKEGMPELQIPLAPASSNKHTISATIWRDECQVVDEGDEFGRWITQALQSKKTLRLVRMAPNEQRPQSQGERFGHENTTQFSDAVSYLVCHQSSLNTLNDALVDKGFEPSTVEQFRPNIVLENTDNEFNAFQEHQVRSFKHQNYTLESRDPCQRCIMPTIDIQTGEKHPKQEPYKTLVTLNPMPDNPKAPAFGQNATLTPESNGEHITIGDNISVIF